MRPILLIAALAATHLASQAATLPVYREFKDWLVACSNSGHCVAKGFDQYAGTTEILLEQAPGPAGETALTLGFQTAAKVPPQPLRLAGLPLPTAAWALQQEADDYAEIHSLDDAAARQLLAAISRKKTLALTGNQGEILASFNADGLAASLLLIDEVQGRLGSRHALLRVGNKPASSIPPARALPVLRTAAPGGPVVDDEEAARLLQAVRKLEPDCVMDGNTQPDGEVSALSPREAVVLLQCGQGAYNTSYVVYRTQRQGKARPVRVNLPGLGTLLQPGYWVMNASYDSASQTLSQYGKGRGLGDCGDSTSWVFDGSHFLLSHYSHQGRCGGMALMDWPLLWDTTILPRKP
ncbi:MAG: DUF1176 domain-containing protein [Chitinimonas sp.]|nr:DUF1176 domain-containing protein [Chitinimonas sp.]